MRCDYTCKVFLFCTDVWFTHHQTWFQSRSSWKLNGQKHVCSAGQSGLSSIKLKRRNVTFWVIQQVLFSFTVFALPSVPEWVIKSADSLSFLHPLQRIPSSLQLWHHLVFCLYRFSVFSSSILYFYPFHSLASCFLALFYISPSQPTSFMLFRFPFYPGSSFRTWYFEGFTFYPRMLCFYVVPLLFVSLRVCIHSLAL